MKILSFIAAILFISACSENTKSSREGKLSSMHKLYISENQNTTGAWHDDPWTKGGTRLGLSSSYDIVKAHGGELTVSTKEGKRFRVYYTIAS